jgi:thiosulfate/3-mercaptopyruvate sulfurtransferase
MDNLVSTQWLMDHLDDPDLHVINCTNFAEWSKAQGLYCTTSGRDQWQAAHIPGSCHADFTVPGFTGDASRYRNTLPAPEAFANAMAQLGVHNAARVVLYDAGDMQWAARVWWMLRWIGFDRAVVLEGGWTRWKAGGGQISNDPHVTVAAELSYKTRPELFVTCRQVQPALEDGALLIDALSPAQFSGQEASLGLKGHIPGAINIPAQSLLDPVSQCLLPMQDLAARLPEDRDRRTIIYCGSGVAAALLAFVMAQTGFEDVAIYMPGLQEWMTHPSLPQSHV